jgi:integrase
MNNLQFLFAKTKHREGKSVSLLDGQLTLFKRSNSDIWQARFKLVNGQWHSASTFSDQLAEASTRAISIYETVKVKIANDLSVVKKSFKSIALEEIEAIKKLQNLSNQTRNDYIYILTNYLIPFFGKYQIENIGDELIGDFASWRVSQMGRVPAKDTQRYHSTTYNRIIKRARANGFINPLKGVPSLPREGASTKPRSAFTKQEIDKLLDFMAYWGEYKRYGRTERSRQMQILCRCYVEFLLYTGIRQGTESMPVRWKDLQWHVIGKNKYLRIWVNGKTGPRYLIARDQLLPSLERLIKWQKLPYKNLNQVIEANLNKLIFVMPEGDQPHGMDGVFQRLMKDSELWIDHAGQKRTLYCLRHTYATFALADGIDIHTLARQMGTSVGMIERHYSKLTPMLSADKLS